jgi:bifunctional UDP-N-acetylglucosamine pyrophosphorylase/glucosamine-1-phosphate N-acetyltransferase
MNDYAALILAAGKGTRMKSGRCKVLHLVAGRPMISYVLEAVTSAGIKKIALVVGHQCDEVVKSVNMLDVEFALQEPQLGTGHAVAAANSLFETFSGNILILCGDIPLIRALTINEFIEFHEQKRSRLSVLTTILEEPFGYGRIVRDCSRHVQRIVEERDAKADEREITEVNTGIYLVDTSLLYSLIKKIQPKNAQKEYYLTDIVAEAVKESLHVEAFILHRAPEVIGINNRIDLARVSAIVWDRTREDLMNSGVTLLDPKTVFVDSQVSIGPDTVVYPFSIISGATEIGKECIIEAGVSIHDCTLGNRVNVLQGSRLNRAVVRDGATIGPMAHLRPEADIGENARIGNFVEVKKTSVGAGTKAAHLTYLGDSRIGKQVNIGCGTITCNYDGKQKHRTIIHDNCFIGSAVQFVAPVEVGEGSLVGAGSTITKDVPPHSLAVSRSKQRIYPLKTGQGTGSRDEDRHS